jgi:hypothetical protein
MRMTVNDFPLIRGRCAYRLNVLLLQRSYTISRRTFHLTFSVKVKLSYCLGAMVVEDVAAQAAKVFRPALIRAIEED